MPFDLHLNPALNLDAFVLRNPASAPPPLNALYLRDGVYDGMTRQDVAATFKAFAAQTATDRLALFFHGGLVKKEAGQQSAANEYLAYQAVAYPLFFIWESGFHEVLEHHLPEIFVETIFGNVLEHAKAVFAPKFAAYAAMGAPALDKVQAADTPHPMAVSDAEIDAFVNAIKSDPAIQSKALEIAKAPSVMKSAAPGLPGLPGSGTSPVAPLTRLSPEVVSAVRASNAHGSSNPVPDAKSMGFTPFDAVQAALAIAKAARPVIVNTVQRFQQGRDHGLRCTLVEEILRALYLANFGSAMWEEMKKETGQAFGADSTQFGGTAVIEEICALVKSRPGTKISLVGHSTGGVYIGKFLPEVDRALIAHGDTTTKFDVILLGPANTFDLFASGYVRSRISGVRMFQMQDATEQQDHLLTQDVGPGDTSVAGAVYPRSLLYLVAGVCEYFEGQGGSGVHALDGLDEPILGMDRYFANGAIFSAENFAGVAGARALLTPGATNHAFARVLSPTADDAPLGFRSKSLKHGNFPGDSLVQESLKECFRNGLR